MQRTKFFALFRILISLSLFALLLWLSRGKFAKIKQLLGELKISTFILAVLLFLFSVVLMAWRLKIALTAQKVYFTLKNLFSLTLIGYFFSNFMPTTVGGDLVKGYYISKKINTRLGSYASVFVDRAVGMFSLALIATIALVIMKQNIEHTFIVWSIIILLFCSIMFILFLLNQKLVKKITNFFRVGRLLQLLKLDARAKKMFEAMNIYANHKKKIVQMSMLSVVAQFIGFFSAYLLALSFSAHIPFAKFLLIMPVIIVLCMLPVTMNGLGLREWAFIIFFSPSIGEATALSLSILYLAMYLLVSLLGGVVYLFWR